MPSSMIAFVPRETSAQELARDNDGALPVEELHTTVMFMSGDEDELPADALNAALVVAEKMAHDFGPFTAAIAGRGQLGSEDPVAEVLFLNSPEMDDIRFAVWTGMEGQDIRDQFRPWIPHMTLSYGSTEFPDVSEVTFDRIRVAVGDDVTDFELSKSEEDEDQDTQGMAATIGDRPGKEGGSRMGTPFRLMIAPMGVSTGDGRRFAEGSLEAAPTPFALEWQRKKDMGHDGSVVVGSVHNVEMTDNQVWATGTFFDDVDPNEMPQLAEDVATAMHLLENGTIGPSVDLDSFEGSPVKEGTDDPLTPEDMEEMEPDDFENIELFVTDGRIRAATLVSIPAFVETSQHVFLGDAVETADDDDGVGLVASVTGSVDLPVADTDRDWDGSGAKDRVFNLCTDGDTVDVECVSRAFLWRDPDADPQTQAAYKLGFADVVNGELQIVPRGVSAAAGGRGVGATEGIPADDKDRIRSRICSLYDKIRSQNEDWPECPFERDENASEENDMAAVIASVSGPDLPDISAFDYPEELSQGPTPITYDFENGRVYGHIAPRSSCHEGFSDRCVTPPMNNDYSLFHRFPVATKDGTVWAGRITAGGNHPMDTESLTAATADYDTKEAAAFVRAGEDEHGIWVSGVLQEGLSANAQHILQRRKVSADWRPTENGLRMVEVLALQPGPKRLSEPGFPITTREKDGMTMALVACLGPFPENAVTASETPAVDIQHVIQQTVNEMMSRQKEREALASELEV